MNNIKGTFELVSGTSQGFSSSDLVVIVTSILSFAGVLVSTIYTSKKTKKINEDNNKFQKDFNQKNYQMQEKWNQKNIDADLKAKARIEWIQNVRNTTAELISLYYQLLNATDKDTLFETLIATQAKAELLILFFGPEVEKNNPETAPQTSLTKLESNEGKNDLIVEFITKLINDFNLYYDMTLKNKKNTLEKICQEKYSIMDDNPIKTIELDPIYNEDGDELVNVASIWNPNLKSDWDEAEKQLYEYRKFIKTLNKELIELRNIMRIYLKIEWNKAKSGE